MKKRILATVTAVSLFLGNSTGVLVQEGIMSKEHVVTVARAEEQNAAAKAVYGTWEGNYTGIKNSTLVERTIRLDVDYCSDDGVIEGIATIDNGENGTYFFDGKIDFETGAITFTGSDWKENPNNFYFAEFSGTLNKDAGIMTGNLDGNEEKTFSISKVSDTYHSMRVALASIPMDWNGEYDGHHDSVVVRRNFEFHIKEVKEDGTISGKAIISPSEKENAKHGANGSYLFEGKVDTRRGKITFQGQEWIDYPVNYENFTFVFLEGYFDLTKGTIDGHSEDGIWNMQSMKYDNVKKTSGFTIGVDSNNYVHTDSAERDGAGFVGCTNYSIDDEYYAKLTSNSSEGEKNKIQKEMMEEWEGSCYGIASTMGLLYEGKLTLSDLTDSGYATNYHTLPYPCKDKKFLNTINYYQLSQSVENGGKQSAAISTAYNNGIFSGLVNWLGQYDSVSVFLKNLVNYVSDDHVALLGFSTAEGGHAVLVTGCEYDEATGQYNVQVYDENTVASSTLDGEFTNMTIEKDFSSFSFVDGNGEIISNKTFTAIYFLDWDKMKSTVSKASVKVATNHTKLDFPIGESFTITNKEGKYITCDGTTVKGDMAIYSVNTIDKDKSSHIVIETDSCDSFTVSDVSDKVDIEAYNNNAYLALEAKQITSAFMSFEQGISLSGSQYSFEAYVSTNEDLEVENALLSISADATSDVNITNEEDGIKVVSNTEMKNIETVSCIGNKMKEEIYDNPSANLEVKVDNENKTQEKEHQWSEWNITKESTVLEVGMKEHTCSKCGEKEVQEMAKLEATIKVNATNIPLKVKQSTNQIKVTGLAKGDSVVSWKSSNTKIVTVNKKGKITAKNKTGKVMVTVKLASGLTKKITVKVQKNAVTTKKLTGIKNKITLKKGKSITLKPERNPITSTSKIVYRSSKKTVVSVNSKGKVTAKKKGKATITITSGKATVKCKVTVK